MEENTILVDSRYCTRKELYLSVTLMTLRQ